MARLSTSMVPEPSAVKPLRAMMRARGATPATPRPLSATAAMVPAMWVPWPKSSLGSASERSSGSR